MARDEKVEDRRIQLEVLEPVKPAFQKLEPALRQTVLEALSSVASGLGAQREVGPPPRNTSLPCLLLDEVVVYYRFDEARRRLCVVSIRPRVFSDP